MTAQRGYAWRRLPCGHAIVWDDQLGAHPVADGFEQRLRDKKGGDMSEWPEDLRVREFPR